MPALEREGEALVLPGETRDFSELSGSVSAIAQQINHIPFAEIGANLNKTLASVERNLGGPELKRAIVSLDATLQESRQLVLQAQAGLGPALERLPRISAKLEGAADQAKAAFGRDGYGSNSTLQRNLERMTDQIADAARSIRLLSDFLNRHPEAVVRGRNDDER
jgi:paraquat-inducible protein B